MNIINFKALATENFSTFSLDELRYCQKEGDKIIANMREIDPSVMDILTKLYEEIDSRK